MTKPSYPAKEHRAIKEVCCCLKRTIAGFTRHVRQARGSPQEHRGDKNFYDSFIQDFHYARIETLPLRRLP